MSDGVSPGAPLLWDGRATYTPGVSERNLTTGQSRFYGLDALGSPRLLADPSWANTDDERFEAFGGTVFHGGSAPTPTPFGFAGAAGYQTDGDTGLMLLGNRYYDPSVGRFITPDHARAGDNWYEYCGNDPLTKTDPTGLVAYAAPGGMYQTASEHLGVLMAGLEAGGWDEGSTQDIMDRQLEENQINYLNSLRASAAAVGQASFDMYLRGITQGQTLDANLGGGLFVGLQGVLGGGVGAAGQATAGLGLFNFGRGINPGAFYSSGGGMLPGTLDSFAAGAAGDLSFGGFFTNAGSAADLSKTTDTWNLSLAEGPLGFAASLSYGHGVWQFSFGPASGLAAEFSHYSTSTVGTHWHGW